MPYSLYPFILGEAKNKNTFLSHWSKFGMIGGYSRSICKAAKNSKVAVRRDKSYKEAQMDFIMKNRGRNLID